MGSERVDFKSVRPDVGSERPDFGSEKFDLRHRGEGVGRMDRQTDVLTENRNWRKLPYVES